MHLLSLLCVCEDSLEIARHCVLALYKHQMALCLFFLIPWRYLRLILNMYSFFFFTLTHLCPSITVGTILFAANEKEFQLNVSQNVNSPVKKNADGINCASRIHPNHDI